MDDYRNAQRTLGYKLIEEEKYIPAQNFDTILVQDTEKKEELQLRHVIYLTNLF